MALMATISRTIPLVGIVNVPSYCKVTMVRGNKHMIEATIIATKDNSDGDVVDTFAIHFVPDLNGVNFIAQAYTNCKTLPQFAGATDC